VSLGRVGHGGVDNLDTVNSSLAEILFRIGLSLDLKKKNL
jgi:hypothetical protein